MHFNCGHLEMRVVDLEVFTYWWKIEPMFKIEQILRVSQLDWFRLTFDTGYLHKLLASPKNYYLLIKKFLKNLNLTRDATGISSYH